MKMKKMQRLCELLSVISAFLATRGILHNLEMAYELGKDESDTLIWEIMRGSIFTMVLISVSILCVLLTLNVRRGNVFTRTNATIFKIGGAIVFAAGLLLTLQAKLASILSTGVLESSLMFYILGLFIVFTGFLFDIGIRMREEQDLTV